MDWLKTSLLGGMGLVALLLVIEWTEFQDAREPEIIQQSSYGIPESDNPIPQTIDQTSKDEELPALTLNQQLPAANNVLTASGQLVTVRNDVLEVVIDTYGGDIIEVRLLQHLTKMAEDGGVPFQLLNRTTSNMYIAQSGLIGPNGTDTRDGRPRFISAQDNYDFSYGGEGLKVDLTFSQNGVDLVKRFTFSRSGYDVGVEYLVNNQTSLDWSATFYGQIKRDSNSPLIESTGVQPYLGAALREAEKNYSKYDFGDMEDETVTASVKGGWVAMVQHYFVSAWIPPAADVNNFFSSGL